MISQYAINSVNISFATILLTSGPWVRSLPSVSQGTWRSYLRVIYVGGSCKAHNQWLLLTYENNT